MNKHEKMLDVIIIGAGPIGINCGIEAQKENVKYKIIEKGCLVNSIYNYPYNMHFFSTSEKLEIGNLPFVSLSPKPTRSEALEYYRRVAMHYRLDIHLYETIKTIKQYEENKHKFFTIKSDKNTYRAKNIIVATGFYDAPYTLDIEGEGLSKVFHYFKEAHAYFNQKVLVVGAANSAIDVALECFRKGAEVTLVIREDSISDRVKYWVRPDIENRIKDGEVKAYYNSSVLKITDQHVFITTPQGNKKIENDFVFAMTGYKPNFDLLKSLGVTLVPEDFNKPTYNPATQESNVKHVFLAGVVCGGLQTNKWFIENSRIHANTIIGKIADSNI